MEPCSQAPLWTLETGGKLAAIGDSGSKVCLEYSTEGGVEGQGQFRVAPCSGVAGQKWYFETPCGRGTECAGKDLYW